MRLLLVIWTACALGTAALAQVDPPGGRGRAPPGPSAGPDVGDSGWWIVFGAFTEQDGIEASVARITGLAAKCGLRTLSATSNHFAEFAPGYTVVVSGAYASRATAQDVAEQVRPCLKDSYVKFSPFDGG